MLTPRVLNLGSGRRRRPDAVNVDVTDRVSPDVVHDLNVRPWPFPDATFGRVYAFDVVEHLNDIVGTMEEIHRVCTDGAVVEIVVPHFSSANAYADPTHRHFFSQATFKYFSEAHPFGFYSSARFHVRRNSLVFAPTLMNRFVHRLANRFPERYERRWAWIFPAWFLSVELAVLKGQTAPLRGGTADEGSSPAA